MLKLNPAFKDYIWGGNKLKELYGKKTTLQITAESWELSTHKDGPCTLQEGEGKVITLTEYLKEKGNLLGTKAAQQDELPILIKLIDAKDHLSVQVHPDDAYAIANEGDLGKTEMWYVLEAEPGAQLVYGFTKDITKEEFEIYIANNTLTEVLNYVEVKKGDTFFIEPGTMHAIGKGLVIAEVQQSSNVTYRVYDYGRVGGDGKPRELHVKQAVEVTNLKAANKSHVTYEMQIHEGYKRGQLASCNYFNVEFIEVDTQAQLRVDETSFHALLILEGDVKITLGEEILEATKGETLFIPAQKANYKVEGTSQILLSYL
ncbi:mannose-6-phosphate isomerase [Sporanaerobium hydrogeniformans]|uniref:Mannose-6-phosphate isomerase n=1 Tax=Sporanaerobium hydrogeniformans TaxID=3072179 RepID=A0AC61D9D2_9FIRM|nr:type I phosphomannose isomerase catalytic subunit [Sporanaerobium hydrogeniformans]PHV69370.1 mannose-6-phosphate isomerase [Sporanaerobium hydrogeniformans]